MVFCSPGRPPKITRVSGRKVGQRSWGRTKGKKGEVFENSGRTKAQLSQIFLKNENSLSFCSVGRMTVFWPNLRIHGEKMIIIKMKSCLLVEKVEADLS